MPAHCTRLAAFSFSAALVLLCSNVSANAATCVPATADGAGFQGCLESSAPGDTILLDSGVYVPTTPIVHLPPQGNAFFIGKRLTIRGVEPGVVLSGALGNGTSAFNVVIINADAAPGLVTLENLTIQDGDSSAGGNFVGGGILATANQTVMLNNVTVRSNAAVIGGGIWTGSGVDSSWNIKNSLFLDNVASGFFSFGGGAIAALPFAGKVSLTIDGSEFDGNSAPGGNGGAVHFFFQW